MIEERFGEGEEKHISLIGYASYRPPSPLLKAVFNGGESFGGGDSRRLPNVTSFPPPIRWIGSSPKALNNTVHEKHFVLVHEQEVKTHQPPLSNLFVLR